MGEARRRRELGIPYSRKTRKRMELEEAKRVEYQAWWDSLTPEQQEAERVEHMRRKHGGKDSRYAMVAAFGLANMMGTGVRVI